jgi:hypothetical protein
MKAVMAGGDLRHFSLQVKQTAASLAAVSPDARSAHYEKNRNPAFRVFPRPAPFPCTNKNSRAFDRLFLF